MTFILPLKVRISKTFSIISTIFIKILSFMEEESNGELALLDTLLKRNNGETYVLL